MFRSAGLLRAPAAFLLLFLTLLLTSREARAQEIGEEPEARLVGSRVHHVPRLPQTAGIRRASAANDTTWIGHSPTGTYRYGPYQVGVGPNRPGSGDPNGVWDWDTFAPGENDSLQGWWPISRTYVLTGGLTIPDTDRPWWAAEYGNVGNYVLNSQHQTRTVGVIGYWHVDGGNAHPGPANAITWAPIRGSGSAWCGLRGHGDLSYGDPITGNPYNQTVLEFQGESGAGSGTSKHFPGYTSQMDQILYRDVELVSSGATLDLSFSYRTAMSTLTNTSAATRTGWFVYDPTIVGAVAVAGPMSGAPNYIANTGTGSPADSFLVYLGEIGRAHV